MLSYKKWKSINESVLGGFNTLGIVTPSGPIRSNMPLATEDDLLGEMKKRLDEAKKKMKKKMGFGGDEEMDGEVVPPASKKDLDPDAEAMAKKNSVDGDGDEEMDGDGDDDHDEELSGDEEGDGGDDETPEMKPDMKKKPIMGGDEDMGGDAREFMKKGKDKDKKKVKKEDTEAAPVIETSPEMEAWTKSVMSMLNTDSVNQKNWDGMGNPKPGELGYAPQQKFGM